AARAGGRAPQASREVDTGRLAGIGADLDRRATKRTVENLATVEGRLTRDAIDFRQALLHFLIQCGTIAVAVGGVGGLNGQFTNALQVVRDFLQGAFGRLRKGDAVVRVTRSLVEAADLRRHALGDRTAGRVILRAVDAQARGQALQRLGELVGGCRQVTLSVQRHHV